MATYTRLWTDIANVLVAATLRDRYDGDVSMLTLGDVRSAVDRAKLAVRGIVADSERAEVWEALRIKYFSA